MGIFNKRPKKLKIAFWAGDENNFQFIDPIIEKLSGKYTVEKFIYTDNNQQVAETLQKFDVVWFEWGNGPILQLNEVKPKAATICRIHKYEVYHPFPAMIPWEKVDQLVITSGGVVDTFKRRFPKESKKANITVLGNGVDTAKYKSNLDRKRGKKIAYVGRFHYHKSPELLLQCFYSTLKKDPGYRLYMLGKFIDPVIEEYFWYQAERLGIKNKMVHEGFSKDVAGWLKDKDIFLQPSIIEGHSFAALEAMACGLKPVLHDYYNSYKVFPKKYLFNSIDQAVSQITSKDFDRHEYRAYVEKNHDLDQQVAKIEDIIKRITG